MKGYLIFALLLEYAVNTLLLEGAGRLSGGHGGLRRSLAGGAVGALYSVLCLWSGLHFLCGSLWRRIWMLLVCLVTFGAEKGMLRPSVIFCLFRLALEGLSGAGGPLTVLWAAVLAGAVMYVFFFQKNVYIPVKLCFRDKKVQCTALYDTGNQLRDPITGGRVLVVGADVADQLTGLTLQQLSQPVENVGCLPGLRLIPYHTVGQGAGFLLAMPIKQTRIGAGTDSCLVAFAPRKLDEQGRYQALIGGTV